jgi:hypothetical protein
LAVLGHQGVVDAEVGVELGQCGGHDALPLDTHGGGVLVSEWMDGNEDGRIQVSVS